MKVFATVKAWGTTQPGPDRWRTLDQSGWVVALAGHNGLEQRAQALNRWELAYGVLHGQGGTRAFVDEMARGKFATWAADAEAAEHAHTDRVRTEALARRDQANAARAEVEARHKAEFIARGR